MLVIKLVLLANALNFLEPCTYENIGEQFANDSRCPSLPRTNGEYLKQVSNLIEWLEDEQSVYIEYSSHAFTVYEFEEYFYISIGYTGQEPGAGPITNIDSDNILIDFHDFIGYGSGFRCSKVEERCEKVVSELD